MSFLKDLRLERIGGNLNEWQIIFVIIDDGTETEESFALYRGMKIKTVIRTLLSFVQKLVTSYEGD